MFVTKKKLKELIEEAMLDGIYGKIEGENVEDRKKVRRLKEDIADLTLKKKMEIEEIKHLNRLAQEKRDTQLEKEKIKLQQEYAEKAGKSLTDFHGKMESRFKEELDNFKGLYSEIIKRLPDVNVALGNSFPSKKDD